MTGRRMNMFVRLHVVHPQDQYTAKLVNRTKDNPMGDIRAIPLRGYNALRYQADAYGCWVSTPVVDFITDPETATATPVTMIPFDVEAVCDPSQNITDMEHHKVFDSISQWIEFRESLAGPKSDAKALKAATPAPEPDEDDETPTLRSLGISGRACAPLERQDIETVQDLSCYRREVIQGTKGVSKEALKEMDAALKDHGLHWLGEEDFHDGDGDPDGDDGDDEDIM